MKPRRPNAMIEGEKQRRGSDMSANLIRLEIAKTFARETVITTKNSRWYRPMPANSWLPMISAEGVMIIERDNRISSDYDIIISQVK